MAPISQLSVLAFASAVLAVPHAQWEPLKRHAHPDAPPAYGGAPPAYGATSSSSAEPVESSAPPSYGSTAPPSYGSSTSEAATVSSSGLVGYGTSSSSSVVAPVSSGPAGYGSSSSEAAATSSSGLVGYGTSSSEAAAISSSGLAGYGSSASPSASVSFSGVPSSGYAHPTGSYGYSTGGYGTGSSIVVHPTGGYSSGPVSYSTCTETSTLIYHSTTAYSTYYVTHTIYPGGSTEGAGSTPGSYPTQPAAPADSAPGGYTAPAGSAPAGEPSGAPVSPAQSGAPGNGVCVPDVTVTQTVKSTIYVTGGGAAPTPSNTYTVSWEQAPSSPAPTPSNTYTVSWEPAPTPSAAPSSPASPSGYSAPSAPVPSSPSAPEPSAPASSGSPPNYGNSGYNGKRGLAYNDASLTNMFAKSSYVGWAYNWGSDNNGLDSGVPFIPTLWGTASEWTDVWEANANAAIANGAKYLFSFNEPDMPSQANLSPEAAAAAWKQYMEPFAGQVKLVAPGVTSGVGEGLGSNWLQQFLTACSDCTIDAIAQHWYNTDGNLVGNFKDTIENVVQVAGGKPVWVNEFGAIGTDEEKSQFLTEVMSYMDSNDDVLGYAYFMVSDGLLCDGDAPSSYGATYMDDSS